MIDEITLADNQITLDMIKLLAKGANRLVYAVQTCWWKIGDPIYKHPATNLPCGPRGEMLLETGNPTGFIELAEKNPEHYGRHGLRAFVTAYHGNVVTKKGKLPTSLVGWERYNDLLDKELSTEGKL